MADSPSSHPQQSPSDRAQASQDDVFEAAGSTNGARYRLMSPAKLPISRSTCIPIPPGLSPTSLLESPVLLSNIKVEPSPTTGSFFKHQGMHGSGGNTAFSIDTNSSSGNAVDGRMTSSFEFRFKTGASSTPGISSTGVSIPVGLNRIGPAKHQDQCYSQSPTPSVLASQAKAVGLRDASVVVSTTDELTRGHSNMGTIGLSSEHKDSVSSVSAERTSDDGYNWRKYGQKLVKGSEFPRSYYKCTYPNCEVKKIFECSPSGQITEIVYKGSHDHPKPQASRRHNSGGLLPILEDKLDKDSPMTDQEGKLNAKNMEQNSYPMFSPLQGNEEGNEGSDPQFHGIDDDVEADYLFLKRRKMEDDSLDVTPVVKPIREPRVVVQTLSEVDILDDGYRWRKYGQKVVRGNPNPRSYYKCTNAGCPVRKHVERASHDPKAVITTYEGKHNHDVPTGKNSSSHGYAEMPETRPQNNGGSISLDLGVGIGCNSLNRANERLQAARDQIGPSDSSKMEVKGSQILVRYSIVNGGSNLYGNRVEDRSFQTPTTTHPRNQCQQNLGSIIMEP